MKNFVVLTVALFAFLGNAEAKFNPPENYITISQAEAMKQISMYDQDKDGRLDADEFDKKKGAKLTRNMRQQIRRAKKEGIYQEPSEQFKTIDTDQDGYVTYQELETYIRNQTRKTKGKVEYY